MEQHLKFGDIATAYARDVVEGRIPSCKWHRLACERHIADLERTDWPYRFNPEIIDSKGQRRHNPALAAGAR